jgi:hypothetical protein
MKDIKGLREKRRRERQEKSSQDTQKQNLFEKVDNDALDEFEAGDMFIICTDCGELNEFSDYCKNCVSSLNPRFTFEKQDMS